MQQPSTPSSSGSHWFGKASLIAMLVGLVVPWFLETRQRRRAQRDPLRKRDIHVWEAEGGRARDA